MLRLDVSRSADRNVPGLAEWLGQAFFQVEIVTAQEARTDKGVIRILTVHEIAHATHRDVLVDYRIGAPSYIAAAAGLPARIAFGAEDADFAFALIAEIARPAGLPAVGDAASAQMMHLAARIARSEATALIQGDTGTGKEGMARFLHLASHRSAKDFIAVNCAALPETMMEAMLFGHKKGSFTGAEKTSEGLFLAANGGTLFLDEIAELPLALQAKLLRALQEGEVLPVGATHPIPVDVRVIAACNQNLAVLCDAGKFRSDLYWRLNVMALELRPLRDRAADIRAIAAALLLRHDASSGAFGFAWPTAQAIDKLMAHDWPGNARELGNVLQRALVLREGTRIDAMDLHITTSPASVAAVSAARAAAQPISLQDVARLSKLEAIRAALKETDGHRGLAARKLGISERTLRYRLAEMRELAAA